MPLAILFVLMLVSVKDRSKGMKPYIEDRAMEIGVYMCDNKTTVRSTAEVFGISKSTVYQDVTDRLPRICSELATKVSVVLQENKESRHIRGGDAIRRKYLAERLPY